MKKTNAPKSKKKAPTKKIGPKSKAKKPKAKKVEKKPEETMDRPTLIGMARLLKGAGSDVKALKKDTDAALQKKVNEAIQRLPPPEVIKLLEAIDPVKLVNALKLDCIGIFVDLSDISCVRCPDAKACVGKFINNVRGGFSNIRSAAVDDKVAPAAAPKLAVVAATRYDAKRSIFIRDVPNPNPEGDDYHDSIQRVLDDQPENLGELREILEQDFDFDGDGDFMKFVTALRDPKEGVLKLDIDLSASDKAVLREAGYDI